MSPCGAATHRRVGAWVGWHPEQDMTGASGPRAIAVLVMMMACLGPLLGWGDAATQGSSGQVSATMRAGRITLSARDARLEEALVAFGRASGIAIYLGSSVAADESITVAFEQLSPEEGLRRLLRAKNFVFVYSDGSLSEVRAYSDRGEEFRKLPTDATATNDAAPADRVEILRFRAQALGDPDPDERSAGLNELAASDDEQLAVETAAQVLLTERVVDVLETALTLLAGAEQVPLEPIMAFVKANRVRDSGLRIQAMELMAERGPDDPRVKDILVTLARRDRDRDVRESAQSLLENLTPN